MPPSIPRSLEEAYGVVQADPHNVVVPEGTELQIIYVFEEQIRAFVETLDFPRERRLEQLIARIYAPFPQLWESFFFKQQHAFAQWAEHELPGLLTAEHPGLRFAFELDAEPLFASTAQKTEAMLQVSPRGQWHLFFGPHGDMGGGGDGTMWANLSVIGREQDPQHYFEFLLPHELSHLVLRQTATESLTAETYTLLHLIIEEGLCSYFNYEYWGRTFSPARNILFTDEDWRWCIAHEREIVQHASGRLASSSWRTIHTYHRSDTAPWPGAPSRLAYFLGFRLCEAYARKNGPESWKDIYHQSAQETLTRSGYLESLEPG